MKSKKLIAATLLFCGVILGTYSRNRFLAVSNKAIILDYMRPRSLEDALCNYVYECDIELVKEAVAMGADVNRNDYYGDLPLYIAVVSDTSGEFREIVDFLLSSGADPSLTHEKGISVLELFSMGCGVHLKDLFEKYGFNV